MLKHKELSDPKSCLNKAAPDELVFVIRAKDPVAAQTVRHWATMSFGLHEELKIAEALAWASAAEQWRNQQFPQVAEAK